MTIDETTLLKPTNVLHISVIIYQVHRIQKLTLELHIEYIQFKNYELSFRMGTKVDAASIAQPYRDDVKAKIAELMKNGIGKK